MNSLIIEGGSRLCGQMHVAGAKNSALPILMATLLTPDKVVVRNVPHLQDITTTMNLMAQMGSKVSIDEHMNINMCNDNINNFNAPYDLVKTMRASILVLGPLLAKFGEAHVSLPGGCAIGVRPVNYHIQAMRQLGAEVELDRGYIKAKCKGRLQGARVAFEIGTVTGTENLMMAAVLAKGETIIENAACEPEIVDLSMFLNSMGAKIEGAGEHTIRITGVKDLHGSEYTVLPDRIEAGTYLVAAAMTGGELKVLDVEPHLLDAVLDKLREAGAAITVKDCDIHLDMSGRKLKAVQIHTMPFPGFPTDMQAQITAMNCIGEGTGIVRETIFESRFMHVQELQRMGADISLEDNVVITSGPSKLSGAALMATDLRSSASLVLAGLVADGYTCVNRIYHIDRGYEAIEEKLNKLGARIRRVSEEQGRSYVEAN
ncbi:MAG: UDP-N-acetylglucosamine 1-carboxyvinyltransferase [Candidatus Porifericomitaceae bacterium WSBS_2022_MAG_OTU9]